MDGATVRRYDVLERVGSAIASRCEHARKDAYRLPARCLAALPGQVVQSAVGGGGERVLDAVGADEPADRDHAAQVGEYAVARCAVLPVQLVDVAVVGGGDDVLETVAAREAGDREDAGRFASTP